MTILVSASLAHNRPSLHPSQVAHDLADHEVGEVTSVTTPWEGTTVVVVTTPQRMVAVCLGPDEPHPPVGTLATVDARITWEI